jgi:hypothetical protein
LVFGKSCHAHDKLIKERKQKEAKRKERKK